MSFRTALPALVTGLVTVAVLVPASAAAQANPAHTHVGHVMDGFSGTPNGQGLLPTAQAEAAIAAQHAGFAARDPENLAAMKQHAAHVLHALDPSRIAQGPGLGYGVKRAAEGVAAHIGLAGSSDGASANVGTHAQHVAASARTVVARADEAIEVAVRIEAAATAAEAAPLVAQLHALTTRIVEGHDANGDGRVTWEEGEGGLQHVEQHMNLLRSAEGLR
jgi:hypothetical protein